MTDRTPLTGQQLADLHQHLTGPLGTATDVCGGTALRLVAEVRRLRAELARRVQCNDCGAVGDVFTADDGLAYLDPTGQIGHPVVSAAGEGE